MSNVIYNPAKPAVMKVVEPATEPTFTVEIPLEAAKLLAMLSGMAGIIPEGLPLSVAGNQLHSLGAELHYALYNAGYSRQMFEDGDQIKRIVAQATHRM